MNHLSYNNGYSEANPDVILPLNIKTGINQPVIEVKPRVAGYLRLSRDDGQYKIESASIQTQRDMLYDFASRQEFSITEVYTDDAWSGTNFDRPSWKRLIADVDLGKINTIIVKDLSRMSRNASDANNFIKEYCREKGTRLIAISDSIDTTVSGNEEIIDIINMYNGWYPRDISKKTRAAKAIKASQGKFIGSNPPFGYNKSPESKHVLVPSEDAPIVYEVFQRVAEGETSRQVCDNLNSRGIITPSLRIVANNPKHPNSVPVSTTWNTTTISNMLNNMVYIGHMVQGKRKNVSYDSSQRIMTPPDKHIVVWDTHEAIIPLELWNAVQAARKGRTGPKKTKQSPEISLFAGFVKCADCGSNLAAQSGKNTLRCAKYNNGGSHACSGHTIRQDALHDIVLTDIQRYTEMATEDESTLINRLYEALVHDGQTAVRSRANRISALRQKQEALNLKVERLYDEKFEKGMDESIFKSMLARYDSDKAAVTAELHAIEIEAVRTRDAEDSIAAWMGAIKNAIAIEELDRNILSALIDRIVVHEREKLDGQTHQQVEIYYKFVGDISSI